MTTEQKMRQAAKDLRSRGLDVDCGVHTQVYECDTDDLLVIHEFRVFHAGSGRTLAVEADFTNASTVEQIADLVCSRLR